ncbi:unnamed protein product, partial [Amoebophrya sp. A25]|eukprot:GSA25T00001091001.1
MKLPTIITQIERANNIRALCLSPIIPRLRVLAQKAASFHHRLLP